MKCTYCAKEAEWVDNATVYGKRYGDSYMMWLCKPCNASVGCHNNTKKPLGIMANPELRKIKMEAKKLWIAKELGEWTTSSKKEKNMAYGILAKKLNIDIDECHFGYFDLDTCNKIKQLYN